MDSAPEFTIPKSRELPFVPPSWAATPPESAPLHFYITKDGELHEAVPLEGRSSWVVGRQVPDPCQIKNTEASISRQNTAFVWHGAEGKCYVIDLKSANGTHVNGTKIDAYKPVGIKLNDEIVCGNDKTTVIKLTEGEVPENAKKRHSGSSNDEAPSSKKRKLDSVTASHLLLKHTKSRNPKTWRGDQVTRTKEEARQQLEIYRKQIMDGTTDLPTLASQYSDCSSAKRKGDLGPFGRGAMQKPFEDAAFSLQIGQISDIVDSDSGLHIILRTA